MVIETKKALIIAVSDYLNLDSLDFCRNDGEQMFKVLQSLGFEISGENTLIGTVGWAQMREAIMKFFADQAVKSNDMLLFYFSGHGVPDGYGENYLATSEIDLKMPYDKGYAFDDFTKMMQRSISTKIVSILDCCYSGAVKIVKGYRDDPSIIATAIMRDKSRILEQGHGKYLLASSQPLQGAFELEREKQSLFTHFVLKGLQGAEGESVDSIGNVTPDTLGRYVYDKVTELSPNQKPIRKVEASGDVILAYYPELRKKAGIGTTISDPARASIEPASQPYLDMNMSERMTDYESRIRKYIKKKKSRRFTYSECARELGMDVYDVIEVLSKLYRV